MESLSPLFMDLAVILITAGVITVIFKWLKQPLVLGYILAGFFIGPYFKWFPAVTDTANLHLWSDIGIVFLMFALGLEFSIKKLKKVGTTGAVTALTELALMFLIGSSVGRLLGFQSMDCIFLGCMLSISSTSIIIKSLDDLKLKQQKFASTVTAVLVVEDLIAVLLLVVLSTISVSRSFNGGALAFSMLKLVFSLVVWFVFGIYLIPTFLRWMRKYMSEETLCIVAVGLCFGMVVMASAAGFSTALGAFMMGAILAETIEADTIHRVIKPLKDLFGAVFFVSVGMLVNPEVLVKYWLPILVIALTVVIFKSLSATSGLLLSGRPIKSAMQCGFCFCQIGEFSFIIAGLGLSFGVINENLYPIIVSVSIITTFATPYMIKAAAPAYDLIEPKLPERFKSALVRYSQSAKSPSHEVSIKLFLRRQLSSVLLHGAILTALYLLSSYLLLPTLDRWFADLQIPHIWSRITGLVVSLVVASPFLWAVAVKNVNRKRLSQLLSTYRHSQAIVIPVLILRYFVAVFFVGLFIGRYINLAVGFVMVLAVITVVIVLFSRKATDFYQHIEERFISNFNQRQAQQSFQIPESLEAGFSMERIPVTPYSPIAGHTLREAALRQTYGVSVVSIERAGQVIDLPAADTIVLPSDRLSVIGSEEQLARLRADAEVEPDMIVHDHSDHEMNTYRYHVVADGPLMGTALRDTDFQHRYNAMVIAIERGDDYILSPPASTVFAEGDTVWFVSPDKITLRRFVES
ncbi:MAG: cation:proton antiporter [Bacteroidales bacterium]|nr:cation:proton antiporter [Bacteroidales bacterium]